MYALYPLEDKPSELQIEQVNCSVLAFECTSNLTAFLACLMLQCTTLGE